MRFERAKEIFFSPKTIEVLHDGSPVWITNLDSDKGNAEVKSLTSDDSIMEVPVSELSEGRTLG